MSSEPNHIRRDVEYNLDLFFELSADLLCIAGFDGYFKRVNPALTSLLGYSTDELFAKPINEFIHPDDRHLTSSYRENIKNGIPLLNFENRYITKTGEIVWLSWTSMPESSLKLVYAVAKNITHKKKLGDHRDLMLKNLTKVNSDLKQLTYTTSHDLRSPLGSLISVLSILDLSKIKDKDTLELMNLIKSSAENMRETLDRQVDHLKREEAFNIQLDEINLKECLSGVIQSIHTLIKDSETTIDTHFDVIDTVSFNRDYLESIFLNLITNSIKYARPEAPPFISIHTREVNGVRQLVFSDNGLGFDMDRVKNKIFGFNQTFHNHKDSEGIGLYLVYNHVTSLGGHITVDSKINAGTTFTISFKD